MSDMWILDETDKALITLPIPTRVWWANQGSAQSTLVRAAVFEIPRNTGRMSRAVKAMVLGFPEDADIFEVQWPDGQWGIAAVPGEAGASWRETS